MFCLAPVVVGTTGVSPQPDRERTESKLRQALATIAPEGSMATQNPTIGHDSPKPPVGSTLTGLLQEPAEYTSALDPSDITQ
jgi:hypothetical protein